MKFVKKSLKLKNYSFYMMFLEMNKMLTDTLSKIDYDNKFKLFAIELIDSIKDVALAIEQSSESNVPEYAAYVKKLSNIMFEFSDKNEDGSAKISEEGSVSISNDRADEYTETIKNLIKEYSSALNDRQTEVDVIKVFMDKEIDVIVPTIVFELIPNAVTAEQMKFLRHLLNEDEE